jgi:hypothetical protein
LGFPGGMRNFEGLDPSYGKDRVARVDFDFLNAEAL